MVTLVSGIFDPEHTIWIYHTDGLFNFQCILGLRGLYYLYYKSYVTFQWIVWFLVLYFLNDPSKLSSHLYCLSHLSFLSSYPKWIKLIVSLVSGVFSSLITPC